MSILESKYIPMKGTISYRIPIKPPKIDSLTGRIRTPEEIKNGIKDFIHSIYIDMLDNVYIIPSKYENEGWYDAYTPIDIVKAAMGDEAAKKLIDEYRVKIKQSFNRDLMSDAFLQRIYDQEKADILNDINKSLLEDGFGAIEVNMPDSPKTAANFSLEELRAIIDITIKY